MFTRAQKKIFLIVLKGIGLHKDICEGVIEYLNENDLFVLAHAIGFQHKLSSILHNSHIDFIHEDNSFFFPDKFGVYCAKNGYGKLLEYFDLGEMYYDSHSSYYSDEKNNLFIASLKNKHYEIAKRLYKRGKVSFGSCESCTIGQIEEIGTFKFFMKVYIPLESWHKVYVSEGAASSGLIENLKYLRSLKYEMNEKLLSESAACNQKEAFDWIEREILKERETTKELLYGTDTLCRHLAYDNNIEMLKYLYAHGYTIGDEIMHSTESVEIIAFGIELGMNVDLEDYIESGNISILKYLSERGYYIPNNVNIFLSAIDSINCEFLQWLIERKCPRPNNLEVNFKNVENGKNISKEFIVLILSLYPNCEWRNIQYVKDVEILKMLNCPLTKKVFTWNTTNFEIIKWA